LNHDSTQEAGRGISNTGRSIYYTGRQKHSIHRQKHLLLKLPLARSLSNQSPRFPPEKYFQRIRMYLMRFADMRSGSEEGSYVRLIDFCITQLKARE